MPEFIDLTVRVRKEKLGDLAINLPEYCQPIRWSVVVAEMVVPKKPKIAPPKRRRRRTVLTSEMIDKINGLKAKGLTPTTICEELGISKASFYKAKAYAATGK